MIGALFVVGIAGWLEINDQSKSHSHKSNKVVGSQEFRKLIERIDTACKQEKQQSKEHSEHCKDVEDFMSEQVTVSDLQAQQGMAFFTEKLSVASKYQHLVGVLTLGLIAWTFWVTRGMLREARRATKAAKKTLIEAEKTTALTRETASAQIFFVFTVGFNGRDPNWPDPKGIREGSEWDEKESVFVDVKVTNYGRSPAMNIICGYESHNCFGFGEFDSDGGPQSVRIETMGPDAERVFGAKTIIRTPQLIQDAPTDGFVFTVEYDNIFGERIFRTQRAGIEFYRGVVRAWDLLGNNAVLPDDWRAMSEEERAKWDVRQLGFVDRVEIESSVTNYGKSRDKSDQKDYPYRSPSVSPTDT